MLKFILNGVLALFAFYLIYAVYQSASFSDKFEISVTRQIAAKPEQVFDFLKMTARFSEWEPWSKADPSLKSHYDGASTGLGSQFYWTSRRRGRVMIEWKHAEPFKTVGYMVSIRDYGGRYDMDFLIDQDPIDDHLVKLTWKLSGKRKMLEKPYWYFFKLESMIRKDFTAGLENISVAIARR